MNKEKILKKYQNLYETLDRMEYSIDTVLVMGMDQKIVSKNFRNAYKKDMNEIFNYLSDIYFYLAKNE